MLRSEIKTTLYFDYLKIFDSISNNSQLKGARSFLRITRRTHLRDYKRALRVINRRVKVCVELPKIKSVGNGMVEEEYPKKGKKNKDNKNKVINVYDVKALSLSKDKK